MIFKTFERYRRMTVNDLLNKYSKEVIIEWITNRYPVFMNKNIKTELEEVKADLEFDKISKKLDSLFKNQSRLREKPFNTNIAIEMEKNRAKIHLLLKRQEKFFR